MALKFIGERTTGALNGMRDGFVKDDLYRVYDAGILMPGGVSVDHGDFVSWDGTKWKLETDIKIARSDEVSNTNSSIAPNYTKKTYEANSYVMQDGVLYTNPNAIGTAEDWNPAHWTQTTVADMMAGAGGGYKQVTKTATYDSDNKRFVLDVNQRESIFVTISPTSAISTNSKLYLNLGTTDDALIIVRKTGQGYRLNGIECSRETLQLRNDYVREVHTETMDSDIVPRILLTNEWEEEHGADEPIVPTDVSNMELLGYGPYIISEVTTTYNSFGDDEVWIIRVIGNNVLETTIAEW